MSVSPDLTAKPDPCISYS